MIDTIRRFDPKTPQAVETVIGDRTRATADRWRAAAAKQDAALKEREAAMLVRPKQKQRLTAPSPIWLKTPSTPSAPVKRPATAADGAAANYFRQRKVRKSRDQGEM